MSTQNIAALLAAADKKNGFPAGTMASVMKQETGGSDKYLADPAAYHYGLNAEGRRVAGHTGKVSTAFGPFGILESTGKDPGYGVAPLKDKSLEEQVRFASDYLAARSKSAGGLVQGLAGYGEGTKYASQVAGRIGIKDAPAEGAVAANARRLPAPVTEAPVVMAEAPVVAEQAPVQVAQAAPPPVDPAQLAAWEDFLQAMPRQAQPQHQPQLQEPVMQMASYGTPRLQVPSFNVGRPQAGPVNFAAFGQWGQGRRA